MMQVRIVSGEAVAARSTDAAALPIVVDQPGLRIEASGRLREWRGANGGRWFVAGELVGVRRADGTLTDPGAVLSDLSILETPRGRERVEGRFVVIGVAPDGACEVWSDRFGTVDLYYQQRGGGAVCVTALDLLSGAADRDIDPVGMATTLTIYGSRPAKQHTLFKDIRRVGVGQGLTLAGGRVEAVTIPFAPLASAPFGTDELDEYADTLIEAIRARGSQYGNVVYLSSGWDSTAILACLVHVFGARRVRAVTGRLRYSERRGIINQFEVDRAQAVAEFFGVKLDIVDLDYRSGMHALMERVRPLFRAQQFYSVTGLGHAQLAEHVAATTGGDEMIFAGEMSDGAHNLGFSQFVTIFHPVMEFREYADKMASYLFGPTFFKLFQDGQYDNDPIWDLFKRRAGEAQFDPHADGQESRSKQFLASFFLRGNRMPLWSLRNGRMLTAGGQRRFSDEMESAYLATAAREVTPETIYAWYLHLYNSFHWQGSTVSPLAYTAEWKGLQCSMPFHDGRLQDFLSAMPESWGRGLEMKPTKYPLKWTLQNRVRYPMHLQVGPHSYIYDVEPGFSLMAELMYDSDLGTVFKESLRSKTFERWLDPDMFDMDYVRSIVQRYLGGTEVQGAERSDVLMLAQLAAVGVHGRD